MTLSGGMKRRVLIGKALSHEPSILFLDEPTAGVDVGLRKEMWGIVEKLRASGVTIILTTHYIEEAEEIADRVGVISNGELLLVEDKCELMQKLGKRQLRVDLEDEIETLPEPLKSWNLEISNNNLSITYTYDTTKSDNGIAELLKAINDAGLVLKDINTSQSSLEDIFINLVKERK
jgi:ABC-2 type transport system ATP-binding protein